MIILFGTDCIIEIPVIEKFVLKFLNELFGGFLLLSAITHFSYADILGSGIVHRLVGMPRVSSMDHPSSVNVRFSKGFHWHCALGILNHSKLHHPKKNGFIFTLPFF